MSAILAFAVAGKVDWTVTECMSSFLYNFSDTKIISVLKWQAKSY